MAGSSSRVSLFVVGPEVGTSRSVYTQEMDLSEVLLVSPLNPQRRATEPERPLIHAAEANEGRNARWAAYLGDEIRGLLEN